MNDGRAEPGDHSGHSGRPVDKLVPRWFLRAVAYSGGLLVIGTLVWVATSILVRLAVVTVTLLAALMLAALLDPVAALLRRAVPAWAAALLTVLGFVGVVSGSVFLLTRRVLAQTGNLGESLTVAVDRIRDWLVSGPLSLSPRQVDTVRGEVTGFIRAALPEGVTAARTAISAVGAVLVMLFVVFFLLKDGPAIWRWFVRTAPRRHRTRVDTAGRQAWEVTSRYMVGVVIIALADAIGIGLGLVLLGVPLALSLTALVFLGAFVPLLGATISGAVAVLVTLVSNGMTDALIVIVIVLAVQNIEGNLLQPLVQRRAVRLHPVVILLAVSSGGLLFGVAGAVIAVPFLAVISRVTGVLRADSEPGAT